MRLGKRVMVAPAASVRGDEGQPIWIGNDVNVQDGVVIHALETHVNGKLIREAVVEGKTSLNLSQKTIIT